MTTNKVLAIVTGLLVGIAILIMAQGVQDFNNHVITPTPAYTYTPEPTITPVQTAIDIYRDFTVYSTRIDGNMYVVEIDIETNRPTAYANYACDGLIADDDGHNCVIVGDDDINSILRQAGLTDLYPHTKGE